MGKLKAKLDEHKEYTLTEKEFNYLKILNYALATSVLKDKCISGFLYHICYSKYGYGDDVNLVFEIDLDEEIGVLKVKELPTEAIEQELQKP